MSCFVLVFGGRGFGQRTRSRDGGRGICGDKTLLTLWGQNPALTSFSYNFPEDSWNELAQSECSTVKEHGPGVECLFYLSLVAPSQACY